MKNKLILVSLAALLQTACGAPPTRHEPVAIVGGGLPAALEYRQALNAMSAAEVARERAELAAHAGDAGAQMRLALLLAQPRQGVGDPVRALALLEGLLKSRKPEAIELHPLARLLAEQLQERQRLEANAERQAAQLKESQRKVQELQEKIERLAEIERSLPQRPVAPLPATGAGR